MLKLAEVRDWLKGFDLFENYYIGRLDTKKKNSLGVYNLADDGRRETIGNLKAYDKKGISLLVHGSANKADTEALAWNLYNALEELVLSGEYDTIGNSKVYFIALRNNEPVDVDQDASATYEYVVELDIYTERQ